MQIHASAQAIDSLNTNEQVLSFLKEKSGYGNNPTFDFKPSRSNRTLPLLSERAKNFKQPSFAKADLDGNCRTDLLFNGYLLPYNQQVSLIMLDMGKDSFSVKELAPIRSQYFATRLVRIDGRPYVEALDAYSVYNEKGDQIILAERYDTLDYQYGEFIERRAETDFKIEQLSYSCCIAWSGPELTLTICGDSVLIIRDDPFARELAHDSGGTYVARLPSETKARLVGLVTHIPIPALKEEYRATGTCHTRNHLKFVYNNGQVKMTTNCEVGVPYSLEALEILLWQLCSTLSWVKIQGDTQVFECKIGSGSK